ncbi:hypothetical protein [Clostridium sp. ZS2-4]|uniref:hypothetical protein n=1 Tax=Clostridium sp. ZS2-4 TaxID=2987703 RepID=UPI00227AF413|nr:hypothetical protein [Clostridium sp. ZS2-4]MCY6353674.1 hypothetical protein [Clostridium sp. ZS2-4]
MKKIIIILFTIILLTGCMNKEPKNMNNEKFYYDNLIEIITPDKSKVINFDNTREGFHGDGDYYVVVQLDIHTVKDFSDKALKSGKWSKLPISNEEVKSFIYGYENKDGTYKYDGHSKGIPSDIKNGIYYFRDIYVENYPKEKDTSILRRPAYNFIFSILDLDTGKLYILQSDS